VNGPQALGLIGALIILISLFEMMRRRRLREKYAAVWFLLATVALIVALWPDILLTFSGWVGVEVPSNLLFFFASLVLLILTLHHSYELGRAEERIRTLAEEVALLRLRLDEDNGKMPNIDS
jgi:hypothetical protein